MDADELRQQLSQCFSSSVVILEDHNGLPLVQLPFYYPDGDAVILRVEPQGNGYFVTDDGEVALRQAMLGFDLSTASNSEAWAMMTEGFSRGALSRNDYELTKVADTASLAEALFDLTAIAQAVDGRFIQTTSRQKRFDHLVRSSVQTVIREHQSNFKLSADRSIETKRTGRRKVTAVVERDNASEVVIQSFSGSHERDQLESLAKGTFAVRAAVIDRSRRIAVARGLESDWSSDGKLEDLGQDFGKIVFDGIHSYKDELWDALVSA